MRMKGLITCTVAAAVVIALVAGNVASAGITWGDGTAADPTLRVREQPRTWNNNGYNVPANRVSGSSVPGNNALAVSNSGTTTYLHHVTGTDGATGAVDWNNVCLAKDADCAATRPALYPYFGAQVAYGGNDAPITNLGLPAYALPYWDGDCGVMRPHLLTDSFGAYAGATKPETLVDSVGATSSATIAAGGVLTVNSPNITHLGGFHADAATGGERLQTAAFPVAVAQAFNRTVTGAAGSATDPIRSAPYWVVRTRPDFDTFTATPDVATPIQLLSGTAAGVFTSSKGGDSVFQGAAIGQLITIAGAIPVAYNGDWRITAAAPATPNVITATPIGAAPVGAMTTMGTVTRKTDNLLTHTIMGATAAASVATYTTSVAHGLVPGNTLTIAGMTTGGYNTATPVVAMAGTGGTTIIVTLPAPPGVSPAVAPHGVATLTTAAATNAQMGTIMKGSSCHKIIYTRSINTGAAPASVIGINWDGGGTGPTGADGCTPSAACGSTNAFDVSAGPSNGVAGLPSKLTEMSAESPMVEAFGQYVYVMFQANNGLQSYPSDFCGNDPRPIYVRVNNDYGRWDAWLPPMLVTPANYQTLYPSFTVDSATGHLYLLAGDSTTGQMNVFKSIDNGSSWSGATVAGQNTGSENYTGFVPPNDPFILGNTGAGSTPMAAGGTVAQGAKYACVNPGRNPYGTDGTDYIGYGNTSGIAAHNGNVGVAYMGGPEGDRIIARISTNGGLTYSGAPQTVLARGADGYCPGFSCPGGPDGQTQAQGSSCYFPYNTSANFNGGALQCANTGTNPNGAGWYPGDLGGFSVTAGPAAAGSRIGFAWVNDSGDGLCAPSCGVAHELRPIISKGLYYKQWRSSPAAWGVTSLVSCMKGSYAGPNGVGTPVLVGTGTVTNFTSNAATMTFTQANTYVAGDIVHVEGIPTTLTGAPMGALYTLPSVGNGNFVVTGSTGATWTAANAAGKAEALRGAAFAARATRIRVAGGGSLNDPCIGKSAVLATAAETFSNAAQVGWQDFTQPSVAFWGTTGVGVVWSACPGRNTAAWAAPYWFPCGARLTDNGAQVLYKESRDSGLNWGSDSTSSANGNASVAPVGSYRIVAGHATDATSPSSGDRMWAINESPDLLYDAIGDSTTGCLGQTAGARIGSPQLTGNPVGATAPCTRFVFFISTTAESAAFDASYVGFLKRGVQT